jgi:predicted transcriptional regulator
MYTYIAWLLVNTLAERLNERQRSQQSDAVNQSDVARLCELDRMTVSQVMKALDTRGLVDRARVWKHLGTGSI